MPDQPTPAASKPGGTNFNMIGFVAMAFVVVGLIGVFATYAAPLPLERAMAREATLDQALTAARAPDPDAALAALAPQLAARLDDSAGVLTGGATGIAARISRERVAMRARFVVDAAATGLRLRWLIVMVTLMSAVFALTMMGGAVRKR